jgi:hypothetical protein
MNLSRLPKPTLTPQDGIKRVRWELDKAWLARHGIDAQR